MQRIRILLWITVMFAALVAGYLHIAQKFSLHPFKTATDPALTYQDYQKIGGEFDIIRSDGTPFTEQDLIGKASIIYFGFTYCPDICPATLYHMSQWYQALGNETLGKSADDYQFLFVTVDPERDTPELMADYIAAFDGITALTGSPNAIKTMLDAYLVTAIKVPLENGDYVVDHTASVYLIDAQGRFHSMIAQGEPFDMGLEKIKQMIKEP